MTFVIVLILAILSVLVIFLSAGTYLNYRELRMDSCRSLINYEGQRINNDVIKLQEDARELALIGELVYRPGSRDYLFAQDAVTSFFRINDIEIGGGIWFEPYKIDPKRRLACVYAFRTSDDVVIDEAFESAEYNYPEQMWYRSVKHQVLWEGRKVGWTQPYFDDVGTNSLMTTVGCAIYDKTGKFAGMSTIDWQLDSIMQRVSSIRPTENSFVLLADLTHDYIVLLTDKNTTKALGRSLYSIGWYKQEMKDENTFSYNGERHFYFERTMDNGMILSICIPVHELFADIEGVLRYTIAALLAFALLIAFTLYNLLDRFVNKPLALLAESVSQIGDGNLDVKVSLDADDELGALASAFNRMTSDLKEHISNLGRVTAERERIGTELGIAKSIQESLLPNFFPSFPDIDEFQIYATMDTAMEVGGDFYDFFLVGEEKLAIVVADVSGKGVSAALFMVVAKTLIKTQAKLGHSAAEVLTMVNDELCENNPLGMFVTAFMAILDIRTGELRYVNAGHNPPLLKRCKEPFAYMDMTPGLVLGAMEGIKYKEGQIRLCRGDILFAYTDGITEAADPDDALFEEARLLEAANKFGDLGLFDLLSGVKEEVEMFVRGAPQSDDITMLAVSYNGTGERTSQEKSGTEKKKEKEITVPASVESLEEVMLFAEGELEKAGCPADKSIQMVTAVEEIFVNIASYSYRSTEAGGKTQSVTVRASRTEGRSGMSVKFIDSGAFFNPTEAADPDTSLPAEEREIGGLGIFMAKKLTDRMEYEYSSGMNILTLTKYFD